MQYQISTVINTKIKQMQGKSMCQLREEAIRKQDDYFFLVALFSKCLLECEDCRQQIRYVSKRVKGAGAALLQAEAYTGKWYLA